MVLFSNINLNQQVEVWHKGKIQKAMVKFKGPLNSHPGDWVGLELERRVGEHDGMITGRRYFFGRENHCIFTSANFVRFIPFQRSSFHKYKTLKDEDCRMKESLFQLERSKSFHHSRRDDGILISFLPKDSSGFRPLKNDISPSEYLRVSGAFELPNKTKKYLKYQADNKDLAKKILMDSPRLSASRKRMITNYHKDYSINDASFISSPSIPLMHMPFNEQKRLVKNGWSDSHIPRHMLVPTGSNSVKLSQWNGF